MTLFIRWKRLSGCLHHRTRSRADPFGLRPPGRLNRRLLAQQSVGHFHVHVLPRWRDDRVDAWPKLPGDDGDLDADLLVMTDEG